MSTTSGQHMHDLLATLVTLAAVAWVLYLLVRWLRSSRPGLSLGLPVTAAMALRIGAAIAISLVGADELRGTDEDVFVLRAQGISEAPFLSGAWTDSLQSDLHQFVLALQSLLLDSPDLALRITHAGVATAGLALLAAAVYELGGRGAAMVAAWLLALEPTNIFFAEILHKEANMILAAGLVSLGGAALWRRGDWRYVVPLVLGCVVATSTRFYAGWFLTAAAVAIALHAWARRGPPSHYRPLAVAWTVAMVAVVAFAVAYPLTDRGSLERLQRHQEAATPMERANLPLEPIDFSTRQGIATGIPRRVRDVLFRPYPWQVGNAQQRLGLLGTLVALAALMWLVGELIRNRGRIVDRAGPLIYVGAFLLLAYALSAANAGAAFRYRTQVVAVALCLIVVLAHDRLQARRAEAARRVRPGRELALLADARELASGGAKSGRV